MRSLENTKSKNLVGGILIYNKDPKIYKLNQNTDYQYHTNNNWRFLTDF